MNSIILSVMKKHSRSTRRLQFYILTFPLILLMIFQIPSGECITTSFRTSGYNTTQQPNALPNSAFAQGTLPGSVLTPVLRLEITAASLADGNNDFGTELVSFTTIFRNTRAKDIAVIAIARERDIDSDSPASPRGPSGLPIEITGGDPDSMSERVGSGPVIDGFVEYSPDEDPIIAYVPMASLLNDPNHPLSPEDRDFTVTINLNGVSPLGEPITPFYARRVTPSSPDNPGGRPLPENPPLADVDDYRTVFMKLDINPVPEGNDPKSDNVVSVNEGLGVFYILVSTSMAIENNTLIRPDFYFRGQKLPAVGMWPPPGLEFASEGDAYLFYDLGGIILRIVSGPECDEEEIPPEEEGGEPTVVNRIAADYYEPNNYPRFQPYILGTHSRLVCVDISADQVPNRKLNNYSSGQAGGKEIVVPNSGDDRPRDNRVWSEFPSSAQPIDNRIWSQFPPGYPPVSIADRSVTNASDYIIAPGRYHPDSGIPTGPYPSPQVMSSGGDYPVFGLDLAGGWAGGYDWRLGGLTLEVQGLGGRRELPKDGIDNDMDGLTDELGIEDTPEDTQLPGRNDDFDFFAELRELAPKGGYQRSSSTPVKVLLTPDGPVQVTAKKAIELYPAVEVPPVNRRSGTIAGATLTLDELKLLDTINTLFEKGRSPGELITGLSGFTQPGLEKAPEFRKISGIYSGSFNRGWDPVFAVIHLMDEKNPSERFTKSAKYYRDVVTPGYDPERGGKGLTDALQPQLRIDFSVLDKENPARAAYMASLIRIGALQSRGLDEDGDSDDFADANANGLPDAGEAGTVTLSNGMVFVIADGIDNDGDGLTDEAIDEEADDNLDNDGDGYVDEDVNFVPVFLSIDEEISNYFVDRDGGGRRANAYDPDPNPNDSIPDGDHVFIDYNNNGIYENGREDQNTPNRDEYQGPSSASPLAPGDPYSPPSAFPIDDDLDSEGEDGNPLTLPLAMRDGIDNDRDSTDFFDTNGNGVPDNGEPGVAFGYVIADGIDNNGDGFIDEGIDEGWNEDVRDVVFGLIGNGRLPYGYVSSSWLYEDSNDNSIFDPPLLGQQGVFIPTISADRPATPFAANAPLDASSSVRLPVPTVYLTDDPDRYLLKYEFGEREIPGTLFVGAMGPDIPVWQDGVYDLFLSCRVPPNMPAGTDFQMTLMGSNLKFAFDSRSYEIPSGVDPKDYEYYWSPPEFNLPISFSMLDPMTEDDPRPRFPAAAQLQSSTAELKSPARSTSYQITKRQIAHIEMADIMGFRSPLEVDGGYRGRPFLEARSEPVPIIGINLSDAEINITERNTRIDSIRVNFEPVSQTALGVFDPRQDLRPLSNTIRSAVLPGGATSTYQFADSGVYLYVDDKTQGIQGEFDLQDDPVPLTLGSLDWNQDKNDPVVKAGGYYVILKPQSPLSVPDTDYAEIPRRSLSEFDPNRGYDFFIVIRTSDSIAARDSFRAFIRSRDIKLVNGTTVTGTDLITHPYVANVPVFLEDSGLSGASVSAQQLVVIPGSNSIPAVGINLHDANQTFNNTPTGWATLGVSLESVGTGFSPSDLLPLSREIIKRIPLDPREDNDGDPRTYPLPDGIDNDNDGLTDESPNNDYNFDPLRYTSLSGLAVFRDMPNSDNNGKFDDPLNPAVKIPDLPVFLSGEEEFIFPSGSSPYVTFALDHDPVAPGLPPGKGDPIDPRPFETIPVNDIGLNIGNDYFVVFRTSRTISQADSFQVRIGTLFGNTNEQSSSHNLTVFGVPFGFMPGATTGLGPVFPERQPYGYTPLINIRASSSLLPVAEEPMSPGAVRIPEVKGYSLVNLETPFNLYESYRSITSGVFTSLESGSDAPSLQFVQPSFSQTVGPDIELDPGTVFTRWLDIDEDSPNALITLVYFPVVEDPILGELLPVTPDDPRFQFTTMIGVRGSLSAGDDIDNFPLPPEPYLNQLIADDNENVDATGQGTDIFTWDARKVPNGLYRIAAILDDQDNPPVVAIGGKVLIENERPVLVITEP